MIKMIRGVFGLPVNGIVKAMDKNSEPFSTTKELEQKLVDKKFAVYVEGVEPSTAPEGDSLDEMNAKELRAYGKEHGLTFRVGMTKEDMVSAIREALAGGEEEAPEGDSLDDEADVPEFDALEAVQ